MPVATTSKQANVNVNRDMWYDRITRLFQKYPINTFCIADVAEMLNAEKSTVSARLNEMTVLHMIQYVEKKRSRTTGLMSKHYQLKVQGTLF